MDSYNSISIMQELEKQNSQLRSLSHHMSVLINAKEKLKLESSESLVDQLQQGLNQCTEKNRKLEHQLKKMTMMKKSSNLAQKEGNLSNYSSDESVEQYTRDVYNHILEMWYFLNSKLKKLKDVQGLPRQAYIEIPTILKQVKERKNAALIEVDLMQKAMNELQASEMTKLQDLVQKRFNYLQNPPDCANARKIVCNINKGCGFGCQVHHVAHCFLVAIGTGRTLILESKNWRYAVEGWESIFLPISDTCIEAKGEKVKWTGEEQTKGAKIISLSIIDGMTRRPPYLPLAIPGDLAPILKKYHGNPPLWWLGQVVSYLMRPNPTMLEALNVFIEKIGFNNPIAGMHVRRTDKVGSEASFHSINEYMVHIIDWFDQQDLKRQRLSLPKIEVRKVYVASDDPEVLDKVRETYEDYEFLGDVEISKSAGMSRRYSRTSLIGVVSDILLLAKCDYLVGTFSSQVSRLAYEIMQSLHTDATTYAHSLDDFFYYGGQGKRLYKAIYDHVPPVSGEIAIKVGDSMGVAGNHWDGFSKGTNQRTGETGLYPSYKVKELVVTANFPTYPGAENFHLNRTKDDLN